MARRRRRSDSDDAPHPWRALPHYYTYPALGFVIGCLSPVGAFLMRYWQADPLLRLLWMRHELQYNALFYEYMGLGTVGAFVFFGYVLGVRSEAQRVRNRILSARLDELHLRSVTDGLTGAYTHGYVRELLELELQKAVTAQLPLSVVIIDVDDFKRVNDSHGHLFGDRVLKETAETISTRIRGEDFLGRMGGDEFLVVMPMADAFTAGQVAGRICAAVSKNGYLSTVSVGTATFNGTETAAELLSRADANLYESKRAGKNRVTGQPA